MGLSFGRNRAWATFWALCVSGASLGAQTVRIATYNLEGYLDAATETRFIKPTESRAKVRDCILTIKPDVIALQEMGRVSALHELREALKLGGLDLPYWEHLAGPDTNIHIAVLSKFPFTAVRPHTNDQFLLSGRRFRVSRGFAEVDIRVSPKYTFTLMAAHLKSRRGVFQADESELRLEEAKLLREKIDARLAAEPELNLAVVGDFNDTPNSPAIKTVIGRGKRKLTDTRPAERNGNAAPLATAAAREARDVAWTHYYAKDDTYSRIDYLLLSPGMTREWRGNESFVLALPDWGLASDHRPIVATFDAVEK